MSTQEKPSQSEAPPAADDIQAEPPSPETLMEAGAQRIAELEAELEEMKNRWMRAEAETQNVRNRAKRRMRAAAQQLVPLFGRPGQDYVLIARNGAPTRPWGRLLDDVKSALLSLRAESQSPVSAKHRAPPPSI